MRRGKPGNASPGRKRSRLDNLLVERGLVDTREKARRMIMAGMVQVAGHEASKPGMPVERDAQVEIKAKLPYVSRGGLKLEAALDEFGIEPVGAIVADIGASTGGFTDCLLQRGAGKVYAIDVGYGQLAWTLRQDARVVVMERVNIRYLNELPEKVDLVTIDVSFISLKLVVPAAVQLLQPEGLIVALIKPQFEAGREQIGKGGIVRDPDVHRQVLDTILRWGITQRLEPFDLIPSPIRGPAGNVEFLVGWRPSPPGEADVPASAVDYLINNALSKVDSSDSD